MESSSILQIVPRPPGSQEGVGDYALTVARKLRQRFARNTTFVTNGVARIEDDFEILSPIDSVSGHKDFEHVILHYVNYGYHKRGVPFRLLSILRQVRRQCPGRLLTIFHELYASGPPWKSAFWLRPFQIQIAKSISRLSDTCIVSGETMLAQIKKLTPHANVRMHPVPSNFGEPSLSPDQFINRSANRWVICGGTVLVERSLRSLLASLNQIPEIFSPRELFILGGKENAAIRSLVVDLPNIRCDYRPEIAVSEASQILSSSTFAWLDYFHHVDVPTDVVLKSSAFAAACAHGVIPIVPSRGSPISLDGDRLPGPFFVDSNSCQLPVADDRAKVAAQFYNWYQRHASSEHLARGIADALGLAATA